MTGQGIAGWNILGKTKLKSSKNRGEGLAMKMRVVKSTDVESIRSRRIPLAHKLSPDNGDTSPLQVQSGRFAGTSKLSLPPTTMKKIKRWA
jgi:hypothetical protein